MSGDIHPFQGGLVWGQCRKCGRYEKEAIHATPLPPHRTEAGYPRCATCDGGGCYDCTDPA